MKLPPKGRWPRPELGKSDDALMPCPLSHPQLREERSSVLVMITTSCLNRYWNMHINKPCFSEAAYGILERSE